jgi:hypothetical protein
VLKISKVAFTGVTDVGAGDVFASQDGVGEASDSVVS